MLRSGSLVSSPYRAADSKPTKLVKANINAIPIDPENTCAPVNETAGNALLPCSPTTSRSKTTSTENSAIIKVPSTFADRSADR